MERLKAVAAGAVWFLGLGYIGLWAVTGPLYRTVAIDVRPETLPSTLHVVGSVAAVMVFVRLLMVALRGSGEPQADPPLQARRRFRRPDPTVKRIKARDHFGLRGLQQ